MRFVVLIVLFLSGCAAGSQKPVDISDVDLNNLHLVGYYTTYSEVCALHFGFRVSGEKVAALTEKYGDNDWFKSGYDINRGLLSSDAVTGIGDCNRAIAIMDANYDKHINNISRRAELPNSEFTHLFSLSWENQLDEEIIVPARILNTGNLLTIYIDDLMPKKSCGAVIRKNENAMSTWYLHCSGGPFAEGKLMTVNENSLISASGKDSEGNNIAFRMEPAAI